MEWRNLVLVLVFAFGIVIGDVYHKFVVDMQTSDCGSKPGFTTLVTEDDGEVICIYRQNGYPFKTNSGRHV
jgi:hypothetical protein